MKKILITICLFELAEGFVVNSALRVSHIMKAVSISGQVSASELAEELNVSVETIRRDLRQLDNRGELIRVHGGAICKAYRDEGLSFNKRASDNVHEKKRLVEKALSHIYEGAIIGLDASSSSWHVAQAIPNIKCTVVTNSLNNIVALASKSNISVINLGGIYSVKYKAFYGLITKTALSNLSLDICFISCSGYVIGGGVWDSNEYSSEVKKSYINSSEKSILLADKSKLNRKSLIQICDFEDLDLLISS